ncbi:MAG: hypothetical protein CMM07_25635 [Rhodopirellula sp.]|nr:hypothetical protein [Rhodopirellula sp.]
MSSITLPLDVDPTRKFHVGKTSGDIFGIEYEGLVVTIELRSLEEAEAVSRALRNDRYETSD